jgi:hypothetical protein
MADIVNAPGGAEFLPCGPDHGDTPKVRVPNQRIEAQAGHYSFPTGSGAGPSQSVNGPLANAFDPLSPKGEKIMSAMKSQYGGKKGEQVFYASKNAGKIKGVD